MQKLLNINLFTICSIKNRLVNKIILVTQRKTIFTINKIFQRSRWSLRRYKDPSWSCRQTYVNKQQMCGQIVQIILIQKGTQSF
jgi:hypothetical protein